MDNHLFYIHELKKEIDFLKVYIARLVWVLEQQPTLNDFEIEDLYDFLGNNYD